MPMTWDSCYNESPDKDRPKPHPCEFCGLPVRTEKFASVYLYHAKRDWGHRGFTSRYPQQKYAKYAYMHKRCKPAFRLASRLQDDEVRHEKLRALADKEYIAEHELRDRMRLTWRPVWHRICKMFFPGYIHAYPYGIYSFWK